MKQLTAFYDTEPLTLTHGYIAALENLMREEISMMRQHDPELSDCWTWGICEVGDLARMGDLDFEYGGDEDKPQWLTTDVAVVVK